MHDFSIAPQQLSDVWVSNQSVCLNGRVQGSVERDLLFEFDAAFTRPDSVPLEPDIELARPVSPKGVPLMKRFAIMLLALVPLEASCVVGGYSSRSGWFIWPGGLLGLLLIVGLLFLLARRRQ